MSKPAIVGSELNGFAFDIGQRIMLVDKKSHGGRRKKGTIAFSYQTDSYELYQVKWDGELPRDSLPWYSPDELKPIGRGSKTVKAVKSKRRHRWWDDIDWDARRPSYRWKSEMEKVDELMTELTTPQQDAVVL